MKQHRLQAGMVFLSLVFLCLYTLPAFAQEGIPITAGNADNLVVVGSFGSEGNSVSTTSIAFGPDSQMVAACAVNGGGIQLWSTRTGAVRLLIDAPCTYLAFSPDGTLIATTDLIDVSIYDVATQAVVATYPGSAFAFSPDGRLLATVSSEGILTIYAAPPGSDDASLPPTSLPAQTVIPFEPTSTPAVATAVPVMPTPAGLTCTLTTNGETNLRSGPGTSFDRTGLVVPNTAIEADGQARGTDGMTWYHLTSNEWVRADLVREPPECSALQVVTP
jgi:WD40 repeat protein